MKNQLTFPAIAAVVGFAIAWVAKPAAPAPAAPTAVTDTVPKRPTRPAGGDSRPSPSDGKRPKEVKATDFPLVESAEKGPQNREEAKMLRLTEALGLTIDQQGEIIRLVEDSHASADPNLSVIEDLTVRGKAIEAALSKLLSPDQLAKFNELRVRERDNQIEVRAQQELTRVIEEVDFSPEQRDQVMERLRQYSRTELQSIPAAATLLFEKSALPTGKTELSVDGVLLLAKMGAPISATDPATAYNQVAQTHRQELEEKLRCYDGILTPAQMGQYYAAVSEQKALMNRFSGLRPPVDPGQNPNPAGRNFPGIEAAPGERSQLEHE